MFTIENSECSEKECHLLNQEFTARFEAGEWDFLSEYDRLAQAEKAFTDEVSRR